MTLPKPFLTYFLICAVPLSLLAALNYANGKRSVDKTAGTIAQNDLNSFVVSVDDVLRQQEHVLLKLALTPEIQRLKDDASLRGNVESSLKSVLELSGYFQSVALFDRDHRPVWFGPTLSQPDDRVWTLQGNVFVDRLIDVSGNPVLQYSVPIHDEHGLGNEGAVVATVDLPKIFSTAARTSGARFNTGDGGPEFTVTDHTGWNIIYKSHPFSITIDATSSPLPRLNATVSVVRDTSSLTSSARRWGFAGIALALFLALTAAFFLDRHVRKRSRGITQVTEDLSAIAKGELDRRIILQSSDDARGLADNINVMTERMRAQIAREEESRQFESFVRLSAMLTHDLKNAIEGLSLTVSNMERHLDNPKFRADALKGLTSAADKLKAIVARLNRPVSSLSGEHKRPTNIDLVPIIRRVVAMTAEPLRDKLTIDLKLPENLFALADPERIEEVIENLVLNAIEAMNEKGGTLTIEAATTATGASTFSISDTGPGMSQAFLDNRLFRPFSTTKKNGIGLGLYTCREVIRATGGTIDVQSVEGAGTTFRVVLPSIPHDRRN